MKVLVIGAGIAGLAVSCRLAARGHKVTLLEKNDDVGGKISTIKKDGFTWDGGPSFFTNPEELALLFTDCGKNLGDYFRWFELDEACRYFYSDTVVYGYDTPVALAKEFEKKFSEPKENTLRFLKDVAKLYDSAGQQFLNEPVTIQSLFSVRTVRNILRLPRHSLGSKLHEMHKRYFKSDRTVQFFDRFATYVGGNPYKTPGMLMAMPHLEHNLGAVQPKGGMRAIIRAVAKLAEELGVVVLMNQEVISVKNEHKKIKNVYTKDTVYTSDIVINAGDVANMYKMTNLKKYKRHSKKEHSLSGYVQYLGVRGKTDSLYLHNILFSDDYEAETKSLWAGEVYNDPTIYINNTSLYENRDAPKNCENWFVMVNVPCGFDEEKLEHLQSVVQCKLEKYFPGITSRIKIQAEALAPSILSEKYRAHKGSIYGLAANSIRGAFLRPKNRDKKIKNLYHVGVTAHPGGGIPLALRSAKIVSEMIN
jgi:phytoene desaturase